VPLKFKNKIRKSKQTTFIYPNKNSYRVISSKSLHYNFINKFKSMYSTSANETNKNFSYDYALEKSDVILYTKNKFMEKSSSLIYKVSNSKIKKIR